MKPVGYCRGWYGRTPQSSRRLASSAQGTPFGCPKGEPYIQACKRHKNKVTHLHKQHLKKSTLPIQARATIGVGKPQADSEVRANSAGRFRCGCPRKLLSSGKSAERCGHRLHIPRKAILHTNSNAHVNSFTTAGMVSMDTSVVTAKMWEA